jgi:large subunit ribosomal protein L25
MKEINVTGQKRTDLGKKASKVLRKEGLSSLQSLW